MIRLILILFFALLYTSCTTSQQSANITSTNKLTFEPNEDGEYDIIVFDPQYETFLLSIARPKTFYSYDYLKTKNRFYTTTWNQRHLNPSVYDPNLYAVSIDLDPNIDYGLDFEFKLFQFFQFIEWKYGIRLT